MRVERVMGTVVSIDLRGGGEHRPGIDAVVRWLHEVDARFSPFREDSEVSRLGRNADPDAPASADLAAIRATCEAVRVLSHGAFDAWRSGRFDPSAFVKGWSVDRAAVLLAQHGCTDWAINAGGDVRVSGHPEPGAAWRVGVRSPFDGQAIIAVVAGTDRAVATSGAYERGDHIRRAYTGAAATGLASVTVVGPALGLADALSTAVFALGPDGPAWLASFAGWECLAIATDGSAVATTGFPRTVHGVPVTAELFGAAA